MYFNLHNLPAGKSMYTVHVTLDPEGTPRSKMSTEEMDIVYDSSAGWSDVVNYGKDDADDRVVDLYGPDCRVVGVVNQSDGFVMYDAFAAGDETGANDL